MEETRVFAQRYQPKMRIGMLILYIILAVAGAAFLIYSITLFAANGDTAVERTVFLVVGSLGFLGGAIGCLFTTKGEIIKGKNKDKPAIVLEENNTIMFYNSNGKEERLKISDIEAIGYIPRQKMKFMVIKIVYTPQNDGTLVLIMKDKKRKNIKYVSDTNQVMHNLENMRKMLAAK